MLYVVFPADDAKAADAAVTMFAQPLKADGQVDFSKSPRQLLQQPDPAGCMTDSLHPAPNGRYLLIQYNCESTLFARLLDIAEQTIVSTTLPAGYFLDWSPQGDYLLFRDMDAEQIWLIATKSITDGRLEQQQVKLPAGTYGVIFAPDGTTLHYVADNGLGFGTDRGIFDLAKNQPVMIEEFPRHVIGTPRWSPDGSQLAYIRMPDSNIPFTIGELWLADENGRAVTLLGEADAGHGYAPVWSPDGQSLLFVQRENTESALADNIVNELHSNLYLADIKTGSVTPITTFKESLVNAPAWAADGKRFAFAANDAIWMVETAGSEPVQISPLGSTARFPVWLPDSEQ